MKLFIILSTLSLIGVFGSELNKESIDRTSMINAIVESEVEFAKASCFCRIGNDRGPRVNEYRNPVKDFGRLKTYKGINPVNQKNDDDCGKRCSKAAANWANNLSDDQLCQYFKKNGNNTLVAYAKVGGKKWSIRQTLKTVKCCNAPGNLICPPGTHSENQNFPGYCAEHICNSGNSSNTRLYNKNGSVWGFIWDQNLYRLVKGKISGAGWQSCR